MKPSKEVSPRPTPLRITTCPSFERRESFGAKRGKHRTHVPVLLFLLAIAGASFHALALEQSVLFVNVHSDFYDGEASTIFTTVTNAGARGTWINLDRNGMVAETLSSNAFDQVWIFDLSYGEDNYTNDWQAIAAWYNSKASLPIICDARMISSYWYGKWPTEGQALSENYYQNLKSRGVGLLLGTDHSFGPFTPLTYTAGINSVNDLIGLNHFVSQFSLSNIPVDTNSFLMNTPNNLGTFLSDDSTPGQAPSGLQPNGKMLYTVAWHSGDQHTPGISTTIAKTTGYHIWITSPPGNSTVLTNQTVSFSVAQSDGVPPFTYTWVSDKDGLLGTGSNLLYSGLSQGTHAITVTGVDQANHIDTDSIWLTTSGLNLYIDHAIEIWWPSATGVVYQVQWTPEAAPTNWQNCGPPVAGTGSTNSVFDSTRDKGKRFYRVVAQ